MLTGCADEYIHTYSAIKTWKSAPDHQIQEAHKWLKTNPSAITHDETQYLEQAGDVVPLVPKAKSPIQRLLATSRLLRLSRIFRARPRAAHANEIGTRYFSEAGFDMFSTCVTIVSGLLLLFGPMWWLNMVNDSGIRLAIITAFVSLFTLLLTLSTISRPFEVLAATAA